MAELWGLLRLVRFVFLACAILYFSRYSYSTFKATIKSYRGLGFGMTFIFCVNGEAHSAQTSIVCFSRVLTLSSHLTGVTVKCSQFFETTEEAELSCPGKEVTVNVIDASSADYPSAQPWKSPRIKSGKK